MRRFALAGLGAALLAAVILPGNSPGIGVLLVALAIAGAVALADSVSRDALIFGALSVALVSMAAVRAAEWVVAVDLLAAVGLATVAVFGIERWGDLVRAPISVLVGVFRTPGLLLKPLLPRGPVSPRLAPVLRGSAIGLLLIVVFGSLFLSADQAFARLTRRFLLPDLDMELFPMQLVVFAVTGAFAAALASVRPALAPEPSPWIAEGDVKEPRRLSRTEWRIALGSLDVLFLVFVVVQLTFLFGGHSLVQRSVGLTYAEYARQGFFQLLVVAGLVLGVIAASVRRAVDADARDRRLLRWMLGALCVLTLLVLASALRRLSLYEEAFGLTRARLGASAIALWLGGVLVLVMAAGVQWRGAWLPRGVLALSAAALLVFSLVNPDGLVASRNVERYERTGKLDEAYLGSLSLDAVPALARLPGGVRTLGRPGLPAIPRDGWPGWNLGRRRAAAVLRSVDSDA